MFQMICDGCHRVLDPDREVQHVVRLEVYPAVKDAVEDGFDADHDELLELEDELAQLDDTALQPFGSDTYYHKSFHLCGHCREKFLRDPMGRKLAAQFDFSEN